MAELHNVYDLFYPTPPPLQETASIQVALGLWRQEIKKQRINNTLDDFDWPSTLPLCTLIPNAPPGILPIIEKYVKKVGASMKTWLKGHIFKDTFKFEILNIFDDFVCDFDGIIHGERTAKRMILCDGISDKVKFILACRYCFEDDIYKFWPLVSSDVNLDSINIHNYTSLFYWICYLKNNLDSITMDFEYYEVSTVEERVVNEILISGDGSWPATRYFWNRLDSEAQMRCLTENHESYDNGGDIICRYILAKLNGAQLKELIREKLSDLSSCLSYIRTGNYSSFAAWSYITHKLNTSQFASLARDILNEYTNSPEKAYYFREIWSNAPNDLKLSAIPAILLGVPVFRIALFEKMQNKNVEFLLSVLSDTSIEDRMTFWNNNWRVLLKQFGTKDVHRLINLCLRNEDEISRFKSRLVSDYQNIRPQCQILLKGARFNELDEFLTFYCPNEQIIREMKSNVLDDNFIINSDHIPKPFLLNRFIEDAYNDVNLANEFKSQLLMSSQTTNEFKYYMKQGRFQRIIEFVDTLAPSEDIAKMVKKREIFPAFTSSLMDESNRRQCIDNIANFMGWCLGGDDEIERFKQSYNVYDLMFHLIAAERWMEWDETKHCDEFGRPKGKPQMWDSYLVKFLQWYFVTRKDFEAFKKQYSGCIMFSDARQRIDWN